eukprot:3687562-Rhodomonas_salina.1
MYTLNLSAPWNIEFIKVTDEISHAPMFPLKDTAPPNIKDIVVTAETSQPSIGTLTPSKDRLCAKRLDMSVMALVSASRKSTHACCPRV